MKRSEFLKILGLGAVAVSIPVLPDVSKKEDEPDIYHVDSIFKQQGSDRCFYIRFEDGKDIKIPDRKIKHMESNPDYFGSVLSMTTNDGRYFTTR